MKVTCNAESIISDLSVESIRSELLIWWSRQGRCFPWRDTRNPYKILIAEILLHRTRADQVVNLYEKFFQHFPDINSVAVSSTEELSEILYSGGLNWRWKLMHAMAVELKDNMNGQIPSDFNTLVSLPGVSHYIASAVRCFAFGYPDVLLDTNTVRVIGRIAGLSITDSSRRSPLFRTILEKIIDVSHPREFNFALIDLSALMCKSRNPIHNECCLKYYCKTFNSLEN